MTNHWNDIANSDCVMIIGCNPAENHPVSFKWITKAMDQGAKLIVVDPRFTRSAAKADLYVRLRPGTDIALMGGLINYVVQNNLYHKDYVANYTNAAFLVNKDFSFHDGLFSGFDKDKHAYDPATWSYEVDAEKKPVTDPTLTNPQCVFQIMKQFYTRYTPELVEQVTGVPKKQFLAMAATFGATGAPGKAGTLLYAMGGTQHTTGVADHPELHHPAAVAGEHGGPRGRHQRPAGGEQRPGFHGHGVLFHILPGYHAGALARPSPHLEGLYRHHPQGRLLDEPAQVLRQPAQGLLGRGGHPGQRLRLRLPAQDRQGLSRLGLLLDSPVRVHGRRAASRACWCGA